MTTQVSLYASNISSFVCAPTPRSRTSPHRPATLIRAKVEPSDKSVEIMRKFSEQYARKSGTYFCVDKGVTSVVIKGLADHKDSLGAPLCPCRHYDDKAAEVQQGFWNFPCVPMRESYDTLVTVTLGRSGRVVKRNGTKRFVGSDRILSASKRLRVDHAKWRPGDSRFKGFWIAGNDLRVKLIGKKHVEERKRSLREKLSKPALLPADGMLRHKVQFKGSHPLRQYSSNEILDDMLPEHAFRRYYTSQTMDGARIRSAEQVWAATRGLSPPRNFDKRRQVPAIRATGVARAGWYFGQVGDACRRTAMRATSETAKPVTFTGGILLTNSHMGMETPTIPDLLHSLGLRKYAILFQAEEVDMATLKQMGNKDLKELGLPLGPRKKILLALQPGSEQHRP